MLFNVYFFIENCFFPENPQPVGEYIISSGGFLLEDTYSECFKRFIDRTPYIRNAGILPSREFQERYKKEHPITVIFKLNVEAENEEIAFDSIKEDFFMLCDLLALERQCPAEHCGHIVVDVEYGIPKTFVVIHPYRGNLLAGFTSASEMIKKYEEAVLTNPSFKLQISLYKEARGEENYDFQYFRYWNLLELMARSDSEEGTALAKVNSMIARIFGSKNISREFNGRDISELAEIWYQHRNCVAHHGACQKDNREICKKNRESCVKCRQAIEEIQKAGHDWYLLILTTITRDILLFRLEFALD